MSASPARSTITEANRHLQAMHTRIQDLESTVKDQAEALMRKDESSQIQLAELASRNELEITKLQQALQMSEQKVQNLMLLNKNKDTRIAQLLEKCEILDNLMQSKPALEGIVHLLSQAQSLSRNPQNSMNSSIPAKLNSTEGASPDLANQENNVLDIVRNQYSNDRRKFSISEDSDGSDFKTGESTKMNELYL